MLRRCTTLAALNVRNKYNRLFKRRFGQSSTFSEYVDKLTRKIGLQNKAASILKAQLLDVHVYNSSASVNTILLHL